MPNWEELYADPAERERVIRIVLERATDGVAVVVISSELEEIQDLSDRVLVIRRGNVVGEFATPADRDAVLTAAHGLHAPPAELPA